MCTPALFLYYLIFMLSILYPILLDRFICYCTVLEYGRTSFKILATTGVILGVTGLSTIRDVIVFFAFPGFLFAVYLCCRSWKELSSQTGNRTEELIQNL